jgi:NADPH:quinone reductase-like Zn-dependent oxidoreductase
MYAEFIPLLANIDTPTELIFYNYFRGKQFTAGKYLKDARPPFDVGFECVGTVVAVGPACTRLKVGQHVAASAYGMFAEYVTLPENSVMVRLICMV